MNDQPSVEVEVQEGQTVKVEPMKKRLCTCGKPEGSKLCKCTAS